MIQFRPRFCKVAILAAFFFISPFLSAQALAPVTFRGLWIVRESMVSRAEIDAALEFAQRGGFNHVFVQVRGRGDAYYRSLIVPRSERIREKDLDPLAYTIRRGHELGLNVHAWVTTYLLWSARKPPANRAHIYHMHPEWLEVRADGSAQQFLDLSAPRDGTFEGIYLSPTHPEVNNYLTAVFTEILLNYAVDGLHLDYVRYYDLDYGYNPAGLEALSRRHNFDPRQLQGASDGAILTATDTDTKFELWNTYRRDRVSELITALHAIITISGKEVMLSAAVKPNIQVARTKYFQDWARWLEDGILDYAVAMNYTPVRSDYLDNIRATFGALRHVNRDQLVMGVATYNQPAEETAEKIRLARLAGVGGIAVFSYDAHKTNLTHFDPILDIINR